MDNWVNYLQLVEKMFGLFKQAGLLVSLAISNKRFGITGNGSLFLVFNEQLFIEYFLFFFSLKLRRYFF